jgi:hypothetical protein
MADEQLDRPVEAVHSHGDQLGGNLVHLKRFLERLQNEEQTFLAEQRAASDAAQKSAHRTEMFSAVAAGAAAMAALFQAYSSCESRSGLQTNPAINKVITAPPQPHTAAMPG